MPAIPTNLAPVDINQEPEPEEHPVGSPEWLAQNYRREFLTRTERGKPNWTRPDYNELARNTTTNMIKEKPENFFTWNLQGQERLSDLSDEAANSLISKDPMRALLHPEFLSLLTREESPVFSVSLAKKLWSNIMQNHNPAGWDRKTDKVLFNRLDKLKKYIEDTEGTSLQMEVGTAPIEFGQVGGPEWVAEKYPRIFLKDKAWKPRNVTPETIQLRFDTASKMAKEDPKKYFSLELHRLDFPDPSGKGMHPTAIAAKNFIDKDPIGALLNKNFFSVILKADRVRGLGKGMLVDLWKKIEKHHRKNDGSVEFDNPIINAWYNNPPKFDAKNLQEDIIGSQCTRLGKKLKIPPGHPLLSRSPESKKDFPGETSSKKIQIDRKLTEDVGKSTRQYRDMESKRKQRLSKRDK